MSKLVRGTLARDRDGYICFFHLHIPTDLEMDESGLWCVKDDIPSTLDFKEFTSYQWSSAYTLKPPRPGKCFEAEIEL